MRHSQSRVRAVLLSCRWRLALITAVGLALLLRAPHVRAQVASISSAAPVLSPVGLWGANAGVAGPVAQANVLSVRITAGAAQNIASLVDNTLNVFPGAVVITTEWSLATAITAIDLVGYFAAPTAALSNGTTLIPSSRLLGRMTTGRPTTFTAFSQNATGGVGTPGGSLLLFRQPIIAPLSVGSRSDNLNLELDLRGMPKLPTGTYSGTLTIRAVAY